MQHWRSTKITPMSNINTFYTRDPAFLLLFCSSGPNGTPFHPHVSIEEKIKGKRGFNYTKQNLQEKLLS